MMIRLSNELARLACLFALIVLVGSLSGCGRSYSGDGEFIDRGFWKSNCRYVLEFPPLSLRERHELTYQIGELPDELYAVGLLVTDDSTKSMLKRTTAEREVLHTGYSIDFSVELISNGDLPESSVGNTAKAHWLGCLELGSVVYLGVQFEVDDDFPKTLRIRLTPVGDGIEGTIRVALIAGHWK